MKHGSIFISFVLAAVLLTGCAAENPNGEDASGLPAETVYTAGFSNLAAEGVKEICAVCTDGQTLYFAAKTLLGGDVGQETCQTRIFGLDPETGEASQLSYTPPLTNTGEEISVGVTALFAEGGKLYIVEEIYADVFDLPADFNEASDDPWGYYTGSRVDYYLTGVDLASGLSSRVNLAGAFEEELYLYDKALTFSGGVLYVYANGRIIAVSDRCEKLFEIELDQEKQRISMLFTLDGGVPAALIYNMGENGHTLHVIDSENEALGEGVTVPADSAYLFYSGGGGFDLLWEECSAIYSLDVQTGETGKVFGYYDLGIDWTAVSSAPAIMDDGSILLVSKVSAAPSYGQDYETGVSYELITLKKIAAGELREKKVFTLATIMSSYGLSGQIAKFNRENPDYRIEVADYSQYLTGSDNTLDPSAAILRLNTEIVAGNVPDIIYYATFDSETGVPKGSLSPELHAAKGLLIDLMPYIESDPDLGTDGLVWPVFEALKSGDGGLYTVTDRFRLMSAVGAASLAGDAVGWAFEEFWAAYGQMPEGASVFFEDTTRDTVLAYICAMCLDAFVDWDTGECSFDSDEFARLLDFLSLFPAQVDPDSVSDESSFVRVAEGRQMLWPATVYSYNTYLMFKGAFGGDVSFVGFPTEDGGGNAFATGVRLGITTACEDPDAAWQFVSGILTGEFQQGGTFGFPTNRALFEEQLEKACTVQYTTNTETGQQQEISKGGYGNLQYSALSEADVDKILGAISATTRVFEYDRSIYDIIADSTASYFAGSRSLDETQAIIQSRVAIYVNEQR